jgi:hypothetical protein
MMDARAFAAPKGFGPAGGSRPRMTPNVMSFSFAKHAPQANNSRIRKNREAMS